MTLKSKNIHVLPTDKPSRLIIYSTLLNEFRLLDEPIEDWKHKKHIYITSDEEINQQTKPCWCINTIKNTWDEDLIYYQGAMPQYHFKGFKKIILTDNKDLIKDGVQAIDDEFLEWFVKNPSCEEVEVEKMFNVVQFTSREYIYKIITPKEEVISDYDVMSNIVYGENVGERFKIKAKIISKEEPKQERMYSEEDMKEAIKFGSDGMYGWQLGEEGYTVNQIERFLKTLK